MHRHEILELEQSLVGSGIRRSVARRSAEELYDHYEDLVACHLARGMTAEAAENAAALELGDYGTVKAAFAARPELQNWQSRYPWVARTMLPLRVAGELTNLDERFAAAGSRWLIGLVMSSVVTTTMMLALQLSITLS